MASITLVEPRSRDLHVFLTGSTFGKARMDDLVRLGCKSAEIELDFSIEGKRYRIKRVLGKSPRVTLIIVKTDSVEEIASGRKVSLEVSRLLNPNA